LRTRNQIILHSLVAKHGTLALDLDIVHKLRFDGLETSDTKIRAFLDAGFTTRELRGMIGDMFIPGIGFLLDIERQGEARAALLRDAEQLIHLAAAAGAKRSKSSPALSILRLSSPMLLRRDRSCTAVSSVFRRMSRSRSPPET
jgi:hypothetical protein